VQRKPPPRILNGVTRRGWSLAGQTLLAAAAAMVGTAWAGGGPENVLLLVNANSSSSLTIANHFVQLRRIPPGNVIYIDWRGSVESVDVAKFRQGILLPSLKEIERRGLTGQIDYLIYSSDFPWSVRLRGDVQGKPPPRMQSPTGSLTGVTYLWQLVVAKSRAVLSLGNNFYVPKTPSGARMTPSHGFRGWYGWGPGGKLLEAGGQTYLLSAMLAVTSGRGTTVDQAIGYLRRSVHADGRRPRGTIYFVQNGTPRSKPRHDLFPAAVAQLKRLGVRGEILRGTVPRNKPDVQGLMIGTPRFDWKQTGSTILPGAFCDNLTSFGGNLRAKAAQTPLTEFLKYGAAGSAGTVVEPMAIRAKFPLPTLQVHYARGCSLAEAFYQAVSGPYQLLFVGDPLCRPWARVPRIAVDGIEPGAKLSGTVTCRPKATRTRGYGVDRFELFVDGRRTHRCSGGGSFKLDTRQLGDGYHELRVVGIDSSPIETQGRMIMSVTVDNHGRAVDFTATVERSPAAGPAMVRMSADCPGAESIVVLHNRRRVATIEGQQGRTELAAAVLGSGPIMLQAVGMMPDGQVLSPPVYLTIGQRVGGS
jgi:hypothetical protein